MHPTHPFWRGVFGTEHPVEIEVGPGTGTFILPAAAANAQVNYLGLERSYSRSVYLHNAVQQQRLTNAIVIAADAACVIGTLIPAASVCAYHIYFPDPWWKRAHHRRRLFTPAFAAALARTLMEGGRLHVATDVEDVFKLIGATVAASGTFTLDPRAHSPRHGATVFERKGLKRGAVIREATFVHRNAALSVGDARGRGDAGRCAELSR